jgi:hypothetical protein
VVAGIDRTGVEGVLREILPLEAILVLDRPETRPPTVYAWFLRIGDASVSESAVAVAVGRHAGSVGVGSNVWPLSVNVSATGITSVVTVVDGVASVTSGLFPTILYE